VSSTSDLASLIQRARNGDAAADQALFDVAYDDLRELARARLRRNRRNTLLDTTSLVHESYLRFVQAGQLRIQDRQQFMRYAGCVMRSVIVDFTRHCMAERRGGNLARVTLTTRLGSDLAGETEILRVHEALEVLAQHDARMIEVVEMRYFGGMTEAEIAEALGVTDRTVRRYWEKARLLITEVLG
jgi:RNA polymerase sigma factor (TIGR02999 family)